MNQKAKLNTQISEEIAIDVERWKQRRLKLGKNKSDEKVTVGDVIMLKRDSKNDAAQFGLVLELSSQNKNAVVRLQNRYFMSTATGNLIPVTSGQSDGREQKEIMGRIGLDFTHFVSVGICEGVDLEWIKAFQDKLGDVPGIGKKKNPRKMHITLGVFNILEEEVEEAEMKFKKVGEKFTDLTSPGSFLLNMKGL